LALPIELAPQCKLYCAQREGARLAWSMTCRTPQNTVRSDGMADYHGSTMDGTMVSHLLGANGSRTDLAQRITGRYLGPCTQPPTITASQPAPSVSPSGSSTSARPPASSGGATPSVPGPLSGDATPGAGR
jgi:hypothetical protein